MAVRARLHFGKKGFSFLKLGLAYIIVGIDELKVYTQAKFIKKSLYPVLEARSL